MGETNSAKSNPEILTHIMDDILLKGHLEPQKPQEFFRRLIQEVFRKGVPWDETVVVDHWSSLQRLGVVVLTLSGMDAADAKTPTA